jgi:integrase/recombinase XerD
MKLVTAVTLFLNEYRNTETQTAYASAVLPLMAYLGEDMPIADIKPLNLVSYHQMLQAKPYAPATRRKHVKGIKTFFNFLIRVELLDRSPARAIKTQRIASYISRDKAMTDDELRLVLDCVRWKPRDHALITFLADTGCRAGGAAGLRLKDLDLDNLRATVIEKGEKSRFVAYGDDCAKSITRWLRTRLEKGQHGEYVFSRRGEQLTADTVSQILRRACIRAGVRSLGSHSLRHRKGHQLADARVAPSIAATALGHSDPVITLQHYYPADWATAEMELRKLAIGAVQLDEKVIRLGG